MIVSHQHDNLRIIFQRAHAQLAASIASVISPEFYPEGISFSDLHTAIADHDDGRQKWYEKSHINSDGFPLDYREQPLSMQLEQAIKSVEIAIYKSPWIGLLISMHQESLYAPFLNKNSEVAVLLHSLTQVQEELIGILNISRGKADQAYQFMKFCDEFSLILCEGRLENQDTIWIGPLGKFTINLSQKKENTNYKTQPWIFKDESFSLSVYYHLISKRRYTNDQDLVTELKKKHPTKLSWDFSI